MKTSKETQDFRHFLQQRLVDACKKNPNYSLRSFARMLDISPSALSAILNGKRPITEKMKLRLGSSLGLNTTQISKMSSKTAAPKNNYYRVALDSFAVISEWYHYAILELTKVKGFESDAGYISKKLGITKSEANFAIERLQRLGYLQEDASGKWIDASPNDGAITNIKNKNTSIASKKLQRQILEKSIEALEQVAIDKRNHTSMTMAVNANDLALAFEMIKKFRRNLCAEMESNPEPTDVYQLHIGFYPATKN